MPLQRLRKGQQPSATVVRVLSAGGVLAAPTETAYGLLVDATSKAAVAKVLRLKGRAVGKPLPLVAANFAMVVKYCRLTKSEQRVAKAFWPGPLTLVLKAKRKFPPGVQARDSTVGIRVPGSAWLRRLSAALGRPLVATSANRAGGVTLYSAAVVRRALAPRGLGYLVDAGRIKPRSTSTVVRLVGRRLIVLRPGTVSVQRLEHVLL